MNETDYEDWEELGEDVNQVYHDLVHLTSSLNSVPKTVWRSEYNQAEDGLLKLKSVLEDRMLEEHPEGELDVFYGNPERDDD